MNILRKSLSAVTISAIVFSTFGTLLAPMAFASTSVTTSAATTITTTNATLNGVNQSANADDSSFWVSTSPFSTATTSPLPSGVFSTPLLGAVLADASFSASLSTVTGILPVTPNTTYYYAAWTDVGGTWSSGTVESFTTTAVPSVLAAPVAVAPANGSSTTTVNQTSASWTSVTNGSDPITYVFQVSHDATTSPDGSFVNQIYNSAPLSTTTISTVGTTEGAYHWHVQATDANGVKSAWSATSMFTVDNAGASGTISGSSSGGAAAGGALAVTSVTAVDTTATADGTFANGWKYIFHITVPTGETHLAMKFADWLSNNPSTIAVANNVRISSMQADNANATILITAANTYSSPALHITSDLDAGTAGMQVDVLVEAAVPANSVNGSYTTSYGVQTLP